MIWGEARKKLCQIKRYIHVVRLTIFMKKSYSEKIIFKIGINRNENKIDRQASVIIVL